MELRPIGWLRAKEIFHLESVWYRGRLVAIYSNKGYIEKWSERSNNDPRLRMGVNMIVFALTQEGGITSIMRHYDP